MSIIRTHLIKKLSQTARQLLRQTLKPMKLILDSLNRITPDIPIISEETYSKDMFCQIEPYWLVDPLRWNQGIH